MAQRIDGDSATGSVGFLDTSALLVNYGPVPPFAEQTRQRLRDASLDVLAGAITAGNPTVSMAAVAREVGVSRQTLYNEFGDREGLLTALADRENATVLAAVLGELDAHGDDLVGAVAAAAGLAVRMAQDDVLHKALLTGDSSTVGVIVGHGESILLRSTAQLSEFMHRRFPDLDPEDTLLLVDVVVRFVQSHLMVPHEAADHVARQVHRLVERYLAGNPAGADRTLTRAAVHDDIPGGSR